jgi:hypothetical protein
MTRALSVCLAASLLVSLGLTVCARAGEKGKEQADKPFTAKGEINLPVHKVKMEKDHLYYIEVQAKGFHPRIVIPGVFLGFGGGLGPMPFPVPPPPPGAVVPQFEQPPLAPLPPLPPEIQKAIDKDRPAPKNPPEIDRPLALPLPEAAVQPGLVQPGLKARPILQPKPPVFQPPFLKQGELRTTFTPKETKEYEIIVLPEFIGDLPKGGKLEYTLTVRQAPKPIMNVTDKWTDKDPKYGKHDAQFKAYPIKMKAGETYIIDLVRTGNDFKVDPYLFLEDKNKEIVAEDDDSGGNLNARIVYTPKADGEFRIIATTLTPATGEYTLTVRGPGTPVATEKK